MAQHEKVTFIDQQVLLDGNGYDGCKFERCELLFSGGTPPTLANSSFIDCSWTFDGPAERTLRLLAAMYGGGFQELIERTFDNIRGKPAVGVKLN